MPAGIHAGSVMHNAQPEELINACLQVEGGCLADTGALMIDTGAFTGRAPEDKYIVRDDSTENKVWWGDVNKPISDTVFFNLLTLMAQSCQGRTLYVQDVFAAADPSERLSVRVITNLASHALFASNMFINPDSTELEDFEPDFTILCLPYFEADPLLHGTRAKNFVIISITHKMVLIGGTGYTGEIKKSVFSLLNFLLPQKGILPMHCSANLGESNDTAIFFGLSGTGKTTLSADPTRHLIGDDEHGWSALGIFNFEGGCYAKVINLSQANEPQIWNAIRPGALLENVRTKAGTNTVDFSNTSVTANTRVSYPLSFIDNAVIPSRAGHPRTIFFLTADALGVLPPIARLNTAQAMFHFVSGYTARVAGTEMGVTEPKTVFSACFGAPFLPLHPLEYAKLLGQKLAEHKTEVYLINTGWTGGAYGTGNRIAIPHTRALITAALSGQLAQATYIIDNVFGFEVPTSVPGVPNDILFPRATWANPTDYDAQAQKLATAFVRNMKKYANPALGDIYAGGPVSNDLITA